MSELKQVEHGLGPNFVKSCLKRGQNFSLSCGDAVAELEMRERGQERLAGQRERKIIQSF